MQLNTQEATLVEAFRRLPPNTAEELSLLVQRLAALAPNSTIDFSDSWSEDDLREFTAHSLRHLETEKDPL